MTFSAMFDGVDGDLLARVRSLCPEPVLHLTTAGAGGNSRLYRVDCAARSYALKSYPSSEQDPRDRLSVEFRALSFMRARGITDVPLAVAADGKAALGLYEWIDGSVIDAPTEGDADAALDFLERLHALRGDADAASLPLASEACLSGREIARQVERRQQRLRAAAISPEGADRDLESFLRDAFVPVFHETLAWAERGYSRCGRDFSAPLPAAARSLCPSDFGFHNVLKRADGRLFFIDFEYFGWDDPVKLTADFLLHPGTDVAAAVKRRLAAGSREIHSDDPAFFARLELLYPLFGLRWCMILLNEFLPERWANRVHADDRRNWSEAKRRQLERARALLAAAVESRSEFPYAG